MLELFVYLMLIGFVTLLDFICLVVGDWFCVVLDFCCDLCWFTCALCLFWFGVLCDLFVVGIVTLAVLLCIVLYLWIYVLLGFCDVCFFSVYVALLRFVFWGDLFCVSFGDFVLVSYLLVLLALFEFVSICICGCLFVLFWCFALFCV